MCARPEPRPLYLTQVPQAEVRRGEGRCVRDFIAGHCRITKESLAGAVGESIILRPWQRRLVDRLFARTADGRRRHRTALIGIPRKNGKTTLIAGVALFGLTLEVEGAEVYSVAGDRDQAKLVFGTAKRMVELDPELARECRLFRDTIEHIPSGSVYRALSADAPLKEGLSPTLTVVDEVHVIEQALWDVFALAGGARVDPLMIGITTAGARYDAHGQATLCYRLWEYGRRVATGEIDDPAFYFEWWGVPDDADHADPAVWALANPGLGDILDPDHLEATLGPTPEPEFRTKHLNQWVVSQAAVFPAGAWEACADPERVIGPREPVVLGFDGSWTGDSTALIGCTLDAHLFEIACWEAPPNDPHWRVESDDVEAAIGDAFHRFKVLELACDPHEWRDRIEAWQAQRLPVTEWPSFSLERIVPAWRAFYAAVMEGNLTHDGSPGFARHVANAVLKVDGRGARPTKEHRTSGRKIDRLVAAVIAYDRARYHASHPRKERLGSFLI